MDADHSQIVAQCHRLGAVHCTVSRLSVLCALGVVPLEDSPPLRIGDRLLLQSYHGGEFKHHTVVRLWPEMAETREHGITYGLFQRIKVWAYRASYATQYVRRAWADSPNS